ncbi:hypothetical protein K450DRAFT_234460 [Umbelopsis ramanniana AG]|uniref:Vacuolar ATPase assembly protein VMA22 n=1 Tax=Umbelopsis ramanniana AG TaxID=1314678 RepID=A0AAD5ECP7_UMBRA|nr:uncharacterized protein K450DRAFT_234460 [Umbelopsis ramanniana AG]KAI8581064.1 hypothetical protein K450DRAFT_234460 [Umbelopsis ramanniana AG]
MNEQLKTVCEKLDQLTVEYIQEADAVSKLKETLGKEIAKGFFDLGQAKYSMGTSKLSRYSYDERMKSLYKIQVDEQGENGNDIFSISNVEFKDENDGEETGQIKDEVTEKLSNLSLRQRKPAHDTPEKEQLETKGEKETTEETKPKTKSKNKKTKEVRKIDRNPLHWFGILVPSSLRTTQQHFKTVVTQIVEEANLVNRLSVLEKRFEELQKEKERILCEVLDSAKQPSQPCSVLGKDVESNGYESEPGHESENELDQVVPEIDASDTA